MKKTPNHTYLIINRPWPIISSFVLASLAMNIHLSLNSINSRIIIPHLLIVIIITYQWWRDLIRESLYEGEHTPKIINITKLSIILFISSEVLLFTRLFWTFLHECLSPDIAIGSRWPPKGIKYIDPLELPIINTIILISSGVFITWAHHSITENKIKAALKGIKISFSLGIYFIVCIYLEYKLSYFSITDRSYGSIFYIITGLHGLHVAIGVLFLIVIRKRIQDIQTSKNHLVRIEFSIWYWHFVDVVWLFLYIIIYWISSYLVKIFVVSEKLNKTPEFKLNS